MAPTAQENFPVFFTAEDSFEKIENKTIPEIKQALNELAETMLDNDAAYVIKEKLNRKTNFKKHIYVELYYETLKAVELQHAESSFYKEFDDQNHVVKDLEPTN